MDGMRWGRGLLSTGSIGLKTPPERCPVNSSTRPLSGPLASAVLATRERPIRHADRRVFFSGKTQDPLIRFSANVKNGFGALSIWNRHEGVLEKQVLDPLPCRALLPRRDNFIFKDASQSVDQTASGA